MDRRRLSTMEARGTPMSLNHTITSTQKPRQRRIIQRRENDASTRWTRLFRRCNNGYFQLFAVTMVLISLASSAVAQPTLQLVERSRSFDDLVAHSLTEREASPQPQDLFDAQPEGSEGEEDEKKESTTTSAKESSTPTSTSPVEVVEGGATATSTVLPQPFDTTLGNNFTVSSCPSFFVDFLSDADFRNCHPFSLLLQTSHGFFTAQRNFFQTTQALEAGCKVDFNKCNAKMQSLAAQLKQESNCMSDYVAQNQIVMQAYNGLVAYPAMYQAACMKDREGDYCFANAITLRENASLADAYSYYLPLGTSMPVGTRPTCNECLQKTMNTYRSYASNSTQPVSDTFSAAAQQVNMACGPEFISATAEIANAAVRGAPSAIVFASLALAMVFGLL